jgi:hypothetical protein
MIDENNPHLARRVYPYSCAARARGFAFSLITLFRAVTLTCFFGGWFTLVANVPPRLVFTSVLAAGGLLGAIVGMRRQGHRMRRIVDAAWFSGGAFVLATYSATVAVAIHVRDRPDTPWDESHPILHAPGPVLALPIILLIIFLMLRAWTSAGNDATIQRDA